MNQSSLERIQEGRLLVVLAAIAMVSPEFLGPLLTPELGGMHWPRLVGTVLLVIGVILRVRWVRWITVGALVLTLVVLLVGPAIFTPPVKRIPYLVLLATLDGFARSTCSSFPTERASSSTLVLESRFVTAPSNKRLKLAGGDRSKGSGVFAPWRARTIVPRRSAGRRVARSLSAIR